MHPSSLLRSCLPRPALRAAAAAAVAWTASATAQAPALPEIAARSYILVDVASQQVLAAKDADLQMEPASLTKLMTGYLVFQALRDNKLTLQQELPVSERAWRTGMKGASRSFIDLNSRVKVDDLIKGMTVQSGNDATVALAEGVGGTVEHFVELMNRQAASFGLKQSTFKNPEGLPAPGHISTARELSVIATRLVRDFPQNLPYYSIKEYSYNKIRQTNRNLLLWRDPTVDGLKTGYTDAAGYCLIATAKRDTPAGQRRLLTVVLGTASTDARANESQKLLNWGYSAFDAVKLFDGGQAVTKAVVWKGKAKEVQLGSLEPIVVTVAKGQGKDLKTDVQRTDPLVAPLTRGQRVGTLKVMAGTQVLAEKPLVVLEPVESAGWFGRMWDAIRLGIR